MKNYYKTRYETIDGESVELDAKTIMVEMPGIGEITICLEHNKDGIGLLNQGVVDDDGEVSEFCTLVVRPGACNVISVNLESQLRPQKSG
ncbi:hypothetical protein [Veronia pacifica]|uniref:Uncharacterized protein n=1 Tax=Veronia pacifica TaxID=1080227 RepID=A0A1C3EG61_9GAMM|nr:hypothetical protein [Veronia pacifica]ODA32242.1 hypothetical protein A8L45_13695 [Veronia pacifica]